MREPSQSVRPAVEAGDSALLGLEAGRGGASILSQGSGDGGARILAGRGGLTIFAHTRRTHDLRPHPEASRILDSLPGPKVWGALILAGARAPLTGRGGRSTTSGACCGRCRRRGRRSRAPPPSRRGAAARRSPGPVGVPARRARGARGPWRGARAAAAPAGAARAEAAPAGPRAAVPAAAAGRRSATA